MKAIVVETYGGPDVLRTHELVLPPVGPDEILVRVKAAGVNPVDTYLRSGAQGYTPSLPYTPGIDAAGIVDAVGANVTGIVPGSRVFVYGSQSGTYAEACICRAGQVFPLPDSLSWEEGACLGVPYFTAWRALFRRAGAGSGDCVLVHGASGAVGNACVQLAAARGLTVFGTAGTPEGEELVRLLGATEVFSHRDPERFSRIREASDGGVDVIVEMLANVNLDNDLGILAPGGRIAVVGSRGRIEIAPRDLMSCETAVLGVKAGMSSLEDRKAAAADILSDINKGMARPQVSKVFSMADAAAAHRLIIEGPHRGNIVLVP